MSKVLIQYNTEPADIDGHVIVYIIDFRKKERKACIRNSLVPTYIRKRHQIAFAQYLTGWIKSREMAYEKHNALTESRQRSIRILRSVVVGGEHMNAVSFFSLLWKNKVHFSNIMRDSWIKNPGNLIHQILTKSWEYSGLQDEPTAELT